MERYREAKTPALSTGVLPPAAFHAFPENPPRVIPNEVRDLLLVLVRQARLTILYIK
jgi:hypothetical protein